jgi:predicted metal-dependent hydrolase
MNLLSSTTWPPLYKIKRHRRAKHVKLRIAELQNLEITVPYRFNVHEIPSILENNKAWIQKHLANFVLNNVDALPESVELPACNERWIIHYMKSPDKKIKLLTRHHLKEIVLIGNTQDIISCFSKLKAWLKKRAKLCLPTLLDNISKTMLLRYNKVSIRDQKTRWGSCSAGKSISLNYKLLFLPNRLVTHVLIHELSHLVHLNHSDKFWSLVARYDSAWKEHRRELRHTKIFIPGWLTLAK